MGVIKITTNVEQQSQKKSAADFLLEWINDLACVLALHTKAMLALLHKDNDTAIHCFIDSQEFLRRWIADPSSYHYQEKEKVVSVK